LVFIPLKAVNPSLENLYSMAQETRAREEARHTSRRGDESQMLREQAAILEIDDIVDYDSNDENNASNQNPHDRAFRGSTLQLSSIGDASSFPQQGDNGIAIDDHQEEKQSQLLSSPTSTVRESSNHGSEPEIIVIDD
jgi:hypothetical protein